LLTELLTLLGVVSVTALACNFYGVVAQWVLPWWRHDPNVLQLVCFFLLLFGGVLFLHALLRKLETLIKWERLHWTIQGMGLILGGIRGLWWGGLAVLLMLALGLPYLTNSIQERSVLGPHLVTVATQSIEWVADRYPGHASRVVLIPTMNIRLPSLFEEEQKKK
jgi:uncharacterized membrane protein required for colicin V production